MPLLSRSAILLAEMAKRYGAAEQIEDPSSLDAIVFRSFDLQIVYAPTRDMFTFSAALGPGSPTDKAPSRGADEAKGTKLSPTRKLRLLRPDGEIERLYGEVAVVELTFPDFAAALDEFVAATLAARRGERIPETMFSAPDLPADELIWIKG